MQVKRYLHELQQMYKKIMDIYENLLNLKLHVITNLVHLPWQPMARIPRPVIDHELILKRMHFYLQK